MPKFNVSCIAIVDVQIDAIDRACAEDEILRRFNLELPTDELHGTKLPEGGEILGLKVKSCEAEEV